MPTVTLPRRPIAVAWTRRFLQPRLAELGFSEDDIFEILVAVCEAVTNAVLHGGVHDPFKADEVTITVSVEGAALQVAVTSPRAGWPVSPPVLPDPAAESGRGLFIIQCFTDSWYVTPDKDGTTLHLTRHLPASGEGGRRPPPGRQAS